MDIKSFEQLPWKQNLQDTISGCLRSKLQDAFPLYTILICVLFYFDAEYFESCGDNSKRGVMGTIITNKTDQMNSAYTSTIVDMKKEATTNTTYRWTIKITDFFESDAFYIGGYVIMGIHASYHRKRYLYQSFYHLDKPQNYSVNRQCQSW